MSKKKKPDPKKKTPPDNRGERPTDPNQLAKWIAEQSIKDHNTDK